MDHFVKSVFQKLTDDIRLAPDAKNLPVKNPVVVSDLVKRAITDLKSHFSDHPFLTKADEINFFKYGKPMFLSESLYASELFTAESGKPFGGPDEVHNYYVRELLFIRRFFDQHRYFYQYYQLDGVELDDIYFYRGNGDAEATVPVSVDADREFSTTGDFLFGKFMALERLQDHLVSAIYPNTHTGDHEMIRIRWTGDVVNLVELIYGLHLTGQINHGNISMNELVRWAESHFDVSIGVIQKKFSEIQRRKRLSPTRFLDQMKEHLLIKIEEGNL